MPDQKDKIGALWIKSSRGGVEFMSGEIEIDGRKQRVTVFRNGFRTETNRQPHYHVYRDAGAPGQATTAPAATPPTAPDAAIPSIDINDDRDSMSSGPDRW